MVDGYKLLENVISKDDIEVEKSTQAEGLVNGYLSFPEVFWLHLDGLLDLVFDEICCEIPVRTWRSQCSRAIQDKFY